MILNGLSDADGSAADCQQDIDIQFNFGASGIDGLLRLDRDTGLVENVPLVYDGSGGMYHLDLILDGGTGDLFKFNDGGTFVTPEPSAIGLLISGLGMLAIWRLRRRCQNNKFLRVPGQQQRNTDCR